MLSIIILNWNTSDLLARCLASLQDATMPHEIIVVDNGSDDGSADRVRADFPGVHLIALAENVGFSRGNNAGLARATGDFLLLLNPDTEVRPGTLASLIAFMETHPHCGIAGPTLWHPDGRHQPSAMPFPSLITELWRQTMLYRLLPFPAQSRMARNRTQLVDAVTGAALCIRRACFEGIGPLDPAIFMFYEDMDWCLRAWRAGWEVWHVQSEGILHVKAASSSRFARTRTLIDSQRSAIYFFQKHHGPWGVRGLRLVTLIGAGVRWLRAALEWLAGHERDDRRRRLDAYARIGWWAVTGRGLD